MAIADGALLVAIVSDTGRRRGRSGHDGAALQLAHCEPPRGIVFAADLPCLPTGRPLRGEVVARHRDLEPA